jgi:murein DD-endopeptidase MepM/ murein hydrolase activator NlpD
MNIIIRAKPADAPRSLNLSGWQVLGIAIVVFFILPAAALYAGKLIGEARSSGELVLSSEWKSDIDRNRQEIERLSRKAREDLNAMSVRLAQLQAQAIRINALGQRLVSIARLDEGEFDFSQPPALGGPEADIELTREIELPDFIRSLDQLASELDDREQRLRVLEDYFMTRNLQENVMPAGWPVKNGWVSSYYGTRTDPFTGRRAMHNGMDFAGKEGTEVLAVAAGIVTFSGKYQGYGHMVEISHGNGYITRYGHNRENLVKAGDVVEKGQAIALMGSTGRSTGPHVHFEVLKNGRGVDPGSYIRAAR